MLSVPSTNAFFIAPFQGARSTLVSYSFLDAFGPLVLNARTRSLSGTMGAKLKFTESWSLTATGSYGRETMHYWGDNQPNAVALRGACRQESWKPPSIRSVARRIRRRSMRFASRAMFIRSRESQ